MAAFDFPNSPNTNDVHTENGVSFKWDGTVWKRQSGTGAQGPTAVSYTHLTLPTIYSV